MSAMLSVLHIITRLDMGGSAQNTLDSCLRLDPQKFAVTLLHGLSAESDMNPEERLRVESKLDAARQQGVRIVAVATLVRRISIFKDLRAFFHMLRHIRQTRPVIVHTHTSKAGLLGRAAAWSAGVPIIIHTPHGHVFYGHFGLAALRFFLLLERLATRITDRLVALTARERADYVKFKVAPEEKLTTIHSGVDIQRFQAASSHVDRPLNRFDVPADATIIGFIGWLLPIKGVQVLIDAMGLVCSRSSRAHLVLVGKGDQEADLKAQARRLGISEKMTFLGWREDVENILPLFDIFVLPSLNEGMGRVLVEAMAAARPIVASKTGGIPDLVIDRQNGLLVPAGDPEAVAAALLEMILQPDQARRMGLAGRRMSAGFSVEAMVAKIEWLYEQMLLTKTIPSLIAQPTGAEVPDR